MTSHVHDWIDAVRKLLKHDAVREMSRHRIDVKPTEIERSMLYWHLWIGAPVLPWGHVKFNSILRKGYSKLRDIPFPNDLDSVEKYFEFLRREIGDAFNVAVLMNHRYSPAFTVIDIDNHDPEATKLDVATVRIKNGREKYTTPRYELIDECTRHGIYVEETSTDGLHLAVKGYVEIRGIPNEKVSGIGIYGSFRGNVVFVYPTHFVDSKPYRVHPPIIAPDIEVDESGHAVDAVPKASPRYLRHILEWYLNEFLGYEAEIIIADSVAQARVSNTKLVVESEPQSILDTLSNEELLLFLYLVAERVGCECVMKAIEHWFEHGVFPIRRKPYPGTGRYLHFHFEVQMLGALYLLGLSETRAAQFLEVFRYPDGIVESRPRETSFRNVYRYGYVNIACAYLCPIGYALHGRHVCNVHGTFVINVLRNRYQLMRQIHSIVREVKELKKLLDESDEARG